LTGLFSGLATALALLVAACGQQGTDRPATGSPLTFAILSVEGQASAEPLWQPFLDDMSRAIGAPVEAHYGAAYDDMVRAMSEGRIEAGWLSALPAIKAIDQAGAEMLVRTLGPGGEDSQHSVLIARAASQLTLNQALACDRSLVLGLGDSGSTSGSLAPKSLLFAPRRIDPETCFREVRSDNHQRNAHAVAAGSLDLAAVSTVTLASMAQRNPQLAEQVKELWRSPPIPEGGILVRANLDPTLKEKLRSFLLTYGEAEGAEGDRQRRILAGLNYSRFSAVDDRYLDPVREMVARQRLSEARVGGDAAAAAAAERDLQSLVARREVLP
jgi:phosphonate transport system substrate-binding protein